MLATDPAFGLAGGAGASELSVKVVGAGGSVTRPYCQVEFMYNSGKSGPGLALLLDPMRGRSAARLLVLRYSSSCPQ